MIFNITDIEFLTERVWKAKFDGKEYSGCGSGTVLESFCGIVKIYLSNQGNF